MARFAVPRYLGETAARELAVREWLPSIPDIVTGLAARWSLTVGEPFQPGGQCSWTAPATDASGTPMVLKVAFRFTSGEERDEAAGLEAWNGNGVVRVHAVANLESCSALLLERCVPGTTLEESLPEPDQDAVVAGLLRRLWTHAHDTLPFRPLTQMCATWADKFEADYAAAPLTKRLEPGLARAGIALFRELPGTASSEVLLCTDLHAGNILAARREPWLVIDPKPYVGDPAYDVLQHMLNCDHRLATDAAGLANRMAGLAGLDSGRVRCWLFARAVQESIGSRVLRRVARQLAPK